MPVHHAVRVIFTFFKLDAWDSGKYFEVVID